MFLVAYYFVDIGETAGDCYSLSPVGFLSRLHDPDVWMVFVVVLRVDLHELLVLSVIEPVDVEGEGNALERILPFKVIVSYQVVEQRFLVGELPVAVEMVVSPNVFKEAHRTGLVGLLFY